MFHGAIPEAQNFPSFVFLGCMSERRGLKNKIPTSSQTLNLVLSAVVSVAL